MAVQQGNELDHSLKVDVLVMDLKVESQAMLHRRDGDPCNRRKPAMTIPTVQDRSLLLAPRCGARGVEAYSRFHRSARCTVTGLFSPCPSLRAPGGNHLLVSLPRSSLWLLGAPSHPLEDVPHIPRMVCHPKIPSYHLGYALQGPQIGRENGCPCAFQQDAFQFLLLFGC